MSDFARAFASTIVAKSDQINADDLVSGPIIVTIREVSVTPNEAQAVSISLADDRRFYRPCKTMRRMLTAMWGDPTSPTAWAGRRLELYRDPTAKWGGEAVGGIRIAGMSDIKREETLMLQIAKGKKQPFTVRPLPTPQRQPDRAPEPPKPAADWRDAAVTSAGRLGVSMLDLVALCGGRGRNDWTDEDKATIRATLEAKKAAADPGAA